ncbi:MAG TPA: phosphatidate cytidylyltransferase [Terriglobales bacterium]|nr:phosphatidate cytidylyltransferase [Terriglobales bacterium]
MKRVLTAIVLIPVVLLAVFRAPSWLFAALVGAVALLATREFVDLAKHYNVTPFRMPTYAGIALMFLALIVRAFQAQTPTLATEALFLIVFTAFAFGAFIYLVVGMMRRDLATSYPAAAASFFALGYCGVPLLLLANVRQQWAGAFLILYLFLVVWTGDTAAYYVGRAIGRHKMAPRVSPGKSWEGGIASFFGSIGIGVLVFSYARPISEALLSAKLIEQWQGYMAPTPPLWQVVVLSGSLNVAAQLGDLVESLLKRGAGVKDSGTLLPGHGGVLDRIDALLFAVPVLWYFAALRVLA